MIRLIIGIFLFTTALINYAIISRPECYSSFSDVSHSISFILQKRFIIYAIVGAVALLLNCIPSILRVHGYISPEFAKQFCFLSVDVALIAINLDILKSHVALKPRFGMDAFNLIVGLIAICLLFDRIPYTPTPAVIMTMTTALTAITTLATLFMLKYFRIVQMLVEFVDVGDVTKIFTFASMVFGINSMCVDVCRDITCWLAFLGLISLMLMDVVLISRLMRFTET